jgi:hypothetical protein
MLKSSMLALTGAAAFALVATAPVSPVAAAPVHLMPAFGAHSANADVVDVQYRRHHRGGRHHGRWDRRRDRGEWLALGIGSAIVGGMIAAQGSQAHYRASSAWERCEANYRSLRADGTYTTYDGRQVLCPYLR